MDVMEGRGSEELSLSCESGPDLEASQRDLNIGSAGWRLGWSHSLVLPETVSDPSTQKAKCFIEISPPGNLFLDAV